MCKIPGAKKVQNMSKKPFLKKNKRITNVSQNLISHLDVPVPKDRKHLIQVLRIFLIQKGYTQLVEEFPHNLCG